MGKGSNFFGGILAIMLSGDKNGDTFNSNRELYTSEQHYIWSLEYLYIIHMWELFLMCSL